MTSELPARLRHSGGKITNYVLITNTEIVSDFFQYKVKYAFSAFLNSLSKKNSRNLEILFVTHHSTKGWILDAKAKRLSCFFPGASRVLYSNKFMFLPDAAGYFYLHQKYFARALKYNPHIRKRKNIVMFTHAEWSKRYSPEHMSYVLNFADKVICLNKAMSDELRQLGLPSEKLEVFHMASDPELFKPKERNGNGAVGFCMGYYPRKNPDLVLELIKALPHRNFILIGRHWNRYARFEEILALPNFTYYDDIPYEKFPGMYRQMDVFVSPSHLEGGPVPLLEAMLCNVVPVVSRTGFGPDLIQHEENGFLFNSTDEVSVVADLVEKAYALKTNVRPYAEKHSWENYGRKIGELFERI